QLITVALGETPPSRISSHPTRRFPWALTIFSTRLVKYPCTSGRLFNPSFFINFFIDSFFSQKLYIVSSPPMSIYSNGNNSDNCPITVSKNVYTSGFVGHRLLSTRVACWVQSIKGSPISGY